MDVKTVGLADLQGLSREDTGFNGSPTKVAKIEVPKAVERESVIYRENLEAFEGKLEEVLGEMGVLR